MTKVFTNAMAMNASFKKGDKVRLSNGKVGVVESGPFPMGTQEMYHIRLEDGKLTDSAERNMTAVNAKNSVARNSFKNPRFVPAAQYYLDDLPAKMKQAFKKHKEDFIHWYSRDVIDGIESKIRAINDGLSSGEGDESEVKALKEMKPKFEKYLAEAKAVIAKVNAL